MTGDAPSPCYCAALREAARALTQRYDRQLAAAGLTITQFSLLAALKSAGLVGVNELAQKLLTDRTTLTRNLLPLQRRRLVASRRNLEDGRGRLLSVTVAGLERLRAAGRAWNTAQLQFETRFGGEQAAALRELSLKVGRGGPP